MSVTSLSVYDVTWRLWRMLTPSVCSPCLASISVTICDVTGLLSRAYHVSVYDVTSVCSPHSVSLIVYDIVYFYLWRHSADVVPVHLWRHTSRSLTVCFIRLEQGRLWGRWWLWWCGCWGRGVYPWGEQGGGGGYRRGGSCANRG